MALTFHQQPERFSPSDNPVVYTFSSDQTGQPNFVYLVDIVINGVKVGTDQVFPTNGIYARYDAKEWVANNCSKPTLPSTLYGDAENYCSVLITVYEYYGDPQTAVTSANSLTSYCWKSALQLEDFCDWTYAPYRADGSLGSVQWLDNFPGGYESGTGSTGLYPKVRREDQSIFLMAINDATTLTDFEYELYDSDDNFVAGYSVASLPVSANRITIFNLSPSVIISASAITQANFDASAYAKVYCAGFLREYRINFDDSCVYPRAQRLHFLTQLGTIQGFTFEMVSHEKATIEGYGYKRLFGEWNGSDFEFNKDRGTDLDYIKHVMRSMVIESNWIEENTQQWMVKNLYSSPYVLQEVGADLVERRIKTASYQFKYYDNNQLFNEVIEIDLPSHSSMVI